MNGNYGNWESVYNVSKVLICNSQIYMHSTIRVIIIEWDQGKFHLNCAILLYMKLARAIWIRAQWIDEFCCRKTLTDRWCFLSPSLSLTVFVSQSDWRRSCRVVVIHYIFTSFSLSRPYSVHDYVLTTYINQKVLAFFSSHINTSFYFCYETNGMDIPSGLFLFLLVLKIMIIMITGSRRMTKM